MGFHPIKWIKKNVKKTWDCGAECFSDAAECFKNGNILDGVLNGAAGVATDVFGTATLGTTTAIGDALSDTADESVLMKPLIEHKMNEEANNERAAQAWKDTQEMYSLAGDHFKNGNIFGGIYQGTMGTLGNVGNGITLGQAGVWGEKLDEKIDYEAEGDGIQFKEDAKVGAIDKVLARMAKGRADSELLQQQCEELGKTGYANLMGAVDCGSLALDIVTGASLAHVASAPIKQITKEGLKQGTKTIAKEGVTIGTKTVVAEGASEVVKEAVKIPVKQWAKKAITKGVVTISVAQVCSSEVNSIIKDTQDGGIGRALTNQIIKQGTNITGDAASVVGDTFDTLSAWFSKHPFIARNVNTIKGIGHATVATLGGTKPVSNVTAWGKKFFDFHHNYDGSSVSAIAEDVRRRANGDNKSFMESYIESVKENDKKYNLDAKDRLFVGNMIDGGANNAEPELA